MSTSKSRQKRKASSLAALTSAALALPGYAPNVSADNAPEKTKLSYRYSQYEEDSVPAQRVAFGSAQRFSIDVHQTQLVAPIGDKWSMSVDYIRETLSGASPWSISPGTDSTPHTVGLSGASISEKRTDISTSVTRYYDKGQASIAAAKSGENDYKSKSYGLAAQRAFKDDHTRVSISVSYSDDDINPAAGVIPINFEHGDKQSYSYFIGASQIINRNIIVRGGLNYTKVKGDLSDPYKLFDLRPNQRQQQAYTLGYKQYLSKTASTLGADYRFYKDNWKVRSHTLDLSWNQQFYNNWHITPSLRYYSQHQASFFSNEIRPPNDPNPGSSDYRLSTFDAISYGLEISYTLENLRILVSAKNYNSNASGLYNSNATDESPALVDFSLYTIGFDYSFNL